jgi:hypothetical protein
MTFYEADTRTGRILDWALLAVAGLGALGAVLIVVSWFTGGEPWPLAEDVLLTGLLAGYWRADRERTRLRRAFDKLAARHVAALTDVAVRKAAAGLLNRVIDDQRREAGS